MRRARFSRGQVVVETAIIMPLFVFLILGLLQMGLMTQARVMAKYAAYKAVRAGSLRQGNPDAMKNAAMAVLVPVIGRATSDAKDGHPYRTDDVGRYNSAWQNLKTQTHDNGVPLVEIKVCNPERGQVDQNSDFDDPRKALKQAGPTNQAPPPDPDDPDPTGGGGQPQQQTPGVSPGQNSDWKSFNATKLQIQVTVFYRMYIPFANWMVWRLASGKEQGSPKKMRWLGWKDDPGRATTRTHSVDTLNNQLISLANNRKYVMPIRTSYAMRMQSNFDQAAIQNLPSGSGGGTSRDCFVPWKRK